jgi:hypothetical protein
MADLLLKTNHIGESEFFPVSEFWYRKKENSEDITREIPSFMKLPTNKQDEGDSQ